MGGYGDLVTFSESPRRIRGEMRAIDRKEREREREAILWRYFGKFPSFSLNEFRMQ